MNEQTNKMTRPPRLVSGLIGWLMIILGLFAAGSWSLLNVQIEKLMRERTSEYAHNIVAIVARIAVDPMIRGDHQQLADLVEKSALNPFILNATLFKENGESIASWPNQQPDSSHSGQDWLESQKNKPFVEAIVSEGRTIGWFKVVLDQEALEKEFRAELLHKEIAIGIFAALLFLLLSYRIYKHSRKVRQVVAACDRLIKINSQPHPRNKKEWFAALDAIKELDLKSLHAFPHAAELEHEWQSVDIAKDVVCLYLHFDFNTTIEPDVSNLRLAESMLNQAVQSIGLQLQGELLSGCLIPMNKSSSFAGSCREAVFVAILIQSLLKRLPLAVEIKSLICQGDLLVLKDDSTRISAVAPVSPDWSAVIKMLSITRAGEIIASGVPESALKQQGEWIALPESEALNRQLLCLRSPNNELLAHVAHQATHIGHILNLK